MGLLSFESSKSSRTGEAAKKSKQAKEGGSGSGGACMRLALALSCSICCRNREPLAPVHILVKQLRLISGEVVVFNAVGVKKTRVPVGGWLVVLILLKAAAALGRCCNYPHLRVLGVVIVVVVIPARSNHDHVGFALILRLNVIGTGGRQGYSTYGTGSHA